MGGKDISHICSILGIPDQLEILPINEETCVPYRNGPWEPVSGPPGCYSRVKPQPGRGGSREKSFGLCQKRKFPLKAIAR